jgi:cytoskeletal protein CcmA (bactofilin family)
MDKFSRIKGCLLAHYIHRDLFLVFLVLLLLFLNTSMVLAFETRRGTMVKVSGTEIIEGDLFIAGDTIIIEGTINGDLIAAGRTIMMNGMVNGSIIAAAETITIGGQTTRAVRIVGNTVIVNGKIGKYLLLAGRDFKMDSSAEVGGDVLFGAGSAYLDGLIKGDVRSGHEWLTVSSTATIQGKLVYTSRREANIESGARITGTLSRLVPQEKEFKYGFNIWWLIISFFMSLLVGIVLILLAPERVKKVTDSIRRRPWASLGWGTVLLIVTPIAALIVCVTIIGIPLGLISLILYAITIYITQIIVGLFIGKWIIGNFGQVKTKAALIGALALGLAIFRLLRLIPYLGFIMGLAAVLFGLGAILISQRKSVKEQETEI